MTQIRIQDIDKSVEECKCPGRYFFEVLLKQFENQSKGKEQ